MYKVNEVLNLIDQARSGDMPQTGNLENADELVGLSFGLYFDDSGQLAHPGPVNEAIADFVVGDEVLRSKNMTLQEELAIAIEAKEPRFANQIDTLKTIKKPGTAFNTHELLVTAIPALIQRGVGSLAVIAFRNHLPRAAAQVRKAGFVVATPDMSGVGDFDPHSPQAWIHDPEAWIKREKLAIIALALLNRI